MLRAMKLVAGCFVVALLGATVGVQIGLAQANSPLGFGNNFFVTGDYVVAGAYNMNVIGPNGYATGTITVPDANPGIHGTKSVPKGAQVVIALLYWQTVEMSGTVPGQAGSGGNGFFRPMLQGGPAAPGYSISGVNLSGHNAVSWSQGGCDTAQTGKVVRTYRADVTGYLPQDANGNVLPNGTYQVMLPSVGNSTPLTLGATLVIIYRVLSPDVPLNSIVIYEGAYGQNSASLNMTQTVQGFYDAAQNPVSKLTHIVGHGLSNKYQTVYLNNEALPSLYGNGQPAFPGHYVSWDNPTWTFPDPAYPGLANPIAAGSASATTQVVPSANGSGCVSWGAVIFSTRVQNSDNDGLLDVWKKNQGYCDASINAGSCTAGMPSTGWVDLSGAVLGTPQNPHPDAFVQLDYMCTFQNGVCGTTTPFCNVVNADGSCNLASPYYSFDPSLTTDSVDGRNAVQKVVDAYAAATGNTHHAPITLHVIKTNAVDETDPAVTCNDSIAPPTCAFPGQPGVVGWPGGLVFLKNQLVDANGNAENCTSVPAPAGCAPRFQHGKKDSYHYVLYGHSLGLPNWALGDGSLAGQSGCPGGNPCVVQSGHTVTFKTSASTAPTFTPDAVCLHGRVTVAFAIKNPSLNGVYCITPANDPTVFTIQVANSTSTTYTALTDPNLAVAPGQASGVSGFSFVGGGDSVITLGSWGAAGTPWNVKAGTLMHELGHSNGLTHGGLFHDTLEHNPTDYTPTYEANCKPNVQSVMSYLFQVDLLDVGATSNVLDYSGQALNTLNETTAGSAPFQANPPFYPNTSWFAPSNSKPFPSHCDGTPKGPNDPATTQIFDQPVSSFSWAAGQDINFDGTSEASLRGHSEWTGTPVAPGLDLRQVAATGNLTVSGGKAFPGGGAGGIQFPGGGAGGKAFPGGGAGGKQFPGGGAGGESVSELNVTTATAQTRPIRKLTASEGASPRTITLGWISPTSGAITKYYIYESAAGGAFNRILTVSATPGAQPGTSYTSSPIVVACNPGGYQFEVTAVITLLVNGQPQDQESAPILVSTGQNGEALTGCYVVSNFSSPPQSVQGSAVQVTWTLTKRSNKAGDAVTTQTANTLVVTGPVPNSCAIGRTTLLANGVPTSGADAFSSSANQFTFTWNNTDAFCAGSYSFELDLDHANGSPAQVQADATPLQLGIDVNDSDSTPHVATLALSAGTVGLAYNNTLTEDGGTAPFLWTSTGSLPPGISLAMNSGALSGTTCAAGNYNFTATITDSKSNSGRQPLTLQINKANTTTSVASNANPSVFQQAVTFTVSVAPQYACTPTGTVKLLDGGTPIALNLPLTGGVATFTTSVLAVGVHNITASYGDQNGGDANFNSSNSAIWVQTVSRASTTIAINSALPSPAVVGQQITVSYTLAVVPPGAGTPIGPSPNSTITVTSTDGSSCMVPAALGTGACALSPTASVAGNKGLTATYSGDSNFAGSVNNPQFNYTVNIYVSDVAPPPFTPATILPNAVVGSTYSNTVYESGGVTGGANPFQWTIVPNSVNGPGVVNGSMLPGLSIQTDPVSGTNGTLSGTPTATGTYTFTAQVTDSAGNTGTQALTLSVADAQFGDLIVIDGAPAVLGGTLFRVTPAGTSGTIAAISNGSPSGVAVDATTGSIYVAVDKVGVNGTSRVVKVDSLGNLTDPFISAGAGIQNPVAVAVDGSGNLYVGDNSTNAVYEFNPSGSPVGPVPFAQLPSSNGVPNHIRMAFDSLGNLDVASDSIGGAAGQIEVDQIASNGTPTVLYNTTTKSSATYALTQASAADTSGNTTYTGTFSPIPPTGSSVTISGFTSGGNNGTFVVQGSSTGTQLVVANSAGTAETPAAPGTATLQLTQIGTVGGVAAFSDGSIDVADFAANAIYKITNPGLANMSVATDISAATAVNPPPSPLCCNISGMANPPGGGNPNLYVTLSGVNNTAPQLQLAIPATSTVSTVNLTYSLTQATAASGGTTAYAGNCSPAIPAGSLVTIAGFANPANNGTFAVVSCSGTQLLVSNANGVAETPNTPGSAMSVPLTSPNDVTWYSKH